MIECSLSFSGSFWSYAIGAGSRTVKKQPKDVAKTMMSITKRQRNCPKGLISSQERKLPNKLDDCTMPKLMPKYFTDWLSRLDSSLMQLYWVLQNMDTITPEIKLPRKIRTCTKVVNPIFTKISPMEMKRVYPNDPTKKVILQGQRPMYLLQRLPRPDPMNRRAVLKGPAQSFPFWWVSWLITPRSELEIPWQIRMTIDTRMTVTKYSPLLGYSLFEVLAFYIARRILKNDTYQANNNDSKPSENRHQEIYYLKIPSSNSIQLKLNVGFKYLSHTLDQSFKNYNSLWKN